MYESLKKHSKEFHLYIFAFDDRSYKLLTILALEHVTAISLAEFEDTELLKIKSTRSKVEYCWTCTPSIIKYSIEKYNLESCTYLDADLYFFSDPSVLIEEMGDKSVLITEHRYTSRYNQCATSGIYCVQFMTFKDDINGMKVLNWWRNVCNEWCYARFEDGKFGDQKYLDDWMTRFDGVHVMRHLGGGVAPWNIQQYDIADSSFKLVFYHFHNCKFLNQDKIELGQYKLRPNDLRIIYMPYLKHLENIKKKLEQMGETYDYHGTLKQKKDLKTPLRIIKRIAKGEYNVYKKDYLIGF